MSSGYSPDRMNAESIKERFPAVNNSVYIDANFNPKGGYVESSLVVEKLTEYACSLGVEIYQQQTAETFIVEKGKLQEVKTREGNTLHESNWSSRVLAKT